MKHSRRPNTNTPTPAQRKVMPRWVRSSAARSGLLSTCVIVGLSLASCNDSGDTTPSESGGASNTGGTSFATAGGSSSHNNSTDLVGGTTSKTGGADGGVNATGGQSLNGSSAGSSCIEQVHVASGRLGTNCASCHKPACNCYLSAFDAELTCAR
jgi:hypothetical protein